MRRVSRIQIIDISLPFDRLFFLKGKEEEERKKERKKEFLNGIIFIFINVASVKVNPQILKVL